MSSGAKSLPDDCKSLPSSSFLHPHLWQPHLRELFLQCKPLTCPDGHLLIQLVRLPHSSHSHCITRTLRSPLSHSMGTRTFFLSLKQPRACSHPMTFSNPILFASNALPLDVFCFCLILWRPHPNWSGIRHSLLHDPSWRSPRCVTMLKILYVSTPHSHLLPQRTLTPKGTWGSHPVLSTAQSPVPAILEALCHYLADWWLS